MARQYFVNGESLCLVKSRADSLIGNLTQLGLSMDPIVITPTIQHRDITLDAWGGVVPNDVQVMLGTVDISINLIHWDLLVLDECLRLSMGFPPVIGTMNRAGTLIGNGLPRFAVGNNYIGLNIASPVGNKPWRFFSAYMTGSPFSIRLGTEKSILSTQWKAIPYFPDPWNAGLGAFGVPVFDYVLDT